MLDDFLQPVGLTLGDDAPSLPAPFRPRPSDGKWTGKTPEEMAHLRTKHNAFLKSFQLWRKELKRDVLCGGNAARWFADVFALYDIRKDSQDALKQWKVFAKRKLRPLLLDTIPHVVSRDCADTLLVLCGVDPAARFSEIVLCRSSRAMMLKFVERS